MKYVTMMVILSCSMISGCEGTDPVDAVTGTRAVANTAEVEPSGGAGTACTVSSVSGGFKVSCPDGTSAIVPNGAMGATGPQGSAGSNGSNGATGASGAAGVNGTNGTNGANGSNGSNGANGAVGATGASGNVLALRGANGTYIGDAFVGYQSGSIGQNAMVWDDASNAVVPINSDGTISIGWLYFTTANCSGGAYVEPGMLLNTVFKNGTLHFKATTGAYICPGSMSTGAGNCSAFVGCGYYPIAAGYTLPASMTGIVPPLSVVRK